MSLGIIYLLNILGHSILSFRIKIKSTQGLGFEDPEIKGIENFTSEGLTQISGWTGLDSSTPFQITLLSPRHCRLQDGR